MDTLTIRCGTCRQRVHPTGGILWADMKELPEHRDAAPAPWRIAHIHCAPVLDAAVYSIELTRACTHKQLLWWTAHLAEKTWLADTTWFPCMREVAETGAMDFGSGWSDQHDRSFPVGGDLPW